MKPLMTTLAVLVVLAALVRAQGAKPDFSGAWIANSQKSDSGPNGPAPAVTLKITHAEPSLLVVQIVEGVETAKVPYVVGGAAVPFTANGLAMQGRAAWEGESMVTYATSDVGFNMRSKLTLSADGKTLTTNLHIETPQGAFDQNFVFDRQ